jgi:hypothetical protein
VATAERSGITRRLLSRLTPPPSTRSQTSHCILLTTLKGIQEPLTNNKNNKKRLHRPQLLVSEPLNRLQQRPQQLQVHLLVRSILRAINRLALAQLNLPAIRALPLVSEDHLLITIRSARPRNQSLSIPLHLKHPRLRRLRRVSRRRKGSSQKRTCKSKTSIGS